MTFFGLVFSAEVGGIRIKTTRRVDLAASRVRLDARRLSDLDNAKRLARRQGKRLDRTYEPTAIGAVHTPSIDSARKLRRAILRRFANAGSGDLLDEVQVAQALQVCRQLGRNVVTLRDAPAAPTRRVRSLRIEKKLVPDPSMSRAEFLHRLDMAGSMSRKLGKVTADVSMTSLIGGLARIKGRTEVQTMAASRFRTLAEQAQIGGARALDYGAVRVDTSGPSQDGVVEATEDARRKYEAAKNCLRGEALGVVERLIVMDQTVSEVAESLGYGKGGTARGKVTGIALSAANDLAEHFGYLGRAAPLRPHVRADGETPTIFTGQVSTRRSV
jgi:hypothetical protein